MHRLYWFFCLIVSCLACAQSSTGSTPVEPTIDGPYRVTALLNDSTWFGAASASKTISLTGESTCAANRFDLRFSTDLPYNQNSSKQGITGCQGTCIPTQVLVLRNVPLAVGQYSITTLNSCAGPDGAATYHWLVGGDGIKKTYTSTGRGSGWIQVTSYNAAQKAVEGTFEVRIFSQADTASFQKGIFKALVK